MNELENKISEILNRIFPLSRNSVEQILTIVEFKELEKMEKFVLLDSVNFFEYIIIDGVCRSYITDYDGNEATLSFFQNGNVIPPNQTRTIHNKSLYNIQALTQTSIVYFSQEKFAKLMMSNMEIERWGICVSENELKHKITKEIDLITLSAKDRLIKFRKKFPLLENQIPHPYIASYLGISPVSLSRLRSQKI